MGKYKEETGAIVVEASIAVPIYAFIIVTLLSLVNICYAQTKVQVALNSAVRHVSEISYILYASDIMEEGGHKGGKSSEAAEKISSNLDEVLKMWGGESGKLGEMSEMIGGTSVADVLEDLAAGGAIKLMMNRELKTTKDGNSADLKKWLKIEGDIEVRATITDNDVLVAGAYYDVSVIKLLNIDFKFSFHNGAMTYLWTAEERKPNVGNKVN